MRLHPLQPEILCPYFRKGGLAFVRRRGSQGDLYRCTAAIPCSGLSLHYRKNRGACGISAETHNGALLYWTQCPGQELTPRSEIPLNHLATWQVAARLQLDTSSVVRLLAAGKLPGLKVNDKWQVPSAALREYMREGQSRRRIARTA